jgi:hypothetical protein
MNNRFNALNITKKNLLVDKNTIILIYKKIFDKFRKRKERSSRKRRNSPTL